MNRPFDPGFILEVIPQLLPYLGVTFLIMISTVFGGGILGFFLARAKIRRKKWSKAIADAYTGIVRCVPSIVLLFVVFYGIPKLLLCTAGINCNSLHQSVFVLITFTIIFSASISEVMRSAYEAIDKGQAEAAISIGLTETQAFFHIILPQCTVVALPNFANSLVGLLKEGALAYTIGLVDVMGKGILIIGNHYGAYALETYLALSVLYWCVTILIEKSFGWLENRLSRGKNPIIVH